MSAPVDPFRISEPGVKISPWHAYGGGFEYQGTAEALIAAGLAAPGAFPGDSGQSKVWGRFVRDGRKLKIARAWQQQDQYVVRVYPTKAESEAHHERQTFELMRQKAVSDLAALPASTDAFRRKMKTDLSKMLGWAAVRLMHHSESPGFRFAPGFRDGFTQACQPLMQFMRTAPVEVDEAERAVVVAAIHEKTAGADSAFATMMQSITAGATNAKA